MSKSITVPPDALTPEQVGERLGVTARRVQVLCSQGKLLGAIKIGRDWFIPEAALKSYTPGKVGRPQRENLLRAIREELSKKERD